MWPLLLPLVVLAAAQGAQYGDYGAVKMPAYSDYDPREAAVDDYRRPTAGAMDYKDEEDGKGNTDKPLNKEYRNDDSWQKPVRKQSKRIRDEEYSEVSNGRSKYRAGHNRPSDDRPTRDFHARSHKRRDDGEDEFSIEKYIQGINENNLEVDVTQAKSRTTDRIIRRKPRDRDNPSDAPEFKDTEFEEEALPPQPQPGRAPPPAPPAPRDAQFMPDFIQDDLRSGDKSDDIGDKGLPRGMLPVEKRVRGETDEMGPRRRLNAPYASEGESAGAPRLRPAQRARLDPGSAEYDTEYYDLKRMRNMRRRPGSDRRPEASEDEFANLAPGVPFAEMDKLDNVDSRRAFRPAPGRRPAGRPTTRRRPSSMRRTTRDRTTSETTTPTSTTTTSNSTTTVTITASVKHTLTPARNGSKELSLAEKSRLSILKKANRKERIGEPSTTKPPVLLQVTQAMPTVVIVASSTTGDPWMRAREVSGDSPETLAKVRRLMRAKLVANAKDIRDLTEDWDQEVCDYVDVKLLQNASPLPRSAPCVAMLVPFALAKTIQSLCCLSVV